MNKVFIAILFLIGVHIKSYSQELYYLIENFETQESRSRWENTPVIVNKQWEYTKGGQYIYGGDPYNPEIPWQGQYNAGLYYPSINNLDTVKLISPYLELEGAGKPTLRFYHCQYEKLSKGPDFLRLFFRSAPSAEWDLITSWESDISFWDDELYDIEDIHPKYLTDSFQLAFEGIIGNGYGVYVDSVSVREDTIVQKFVKSVKYNTIEYDAVPGGATDIPLEEIVIRILGNTGDARLDSLTLIPTGTGVNDLTADGFKLFYSSNDVFAPFLNDTSTIVSTATLQDGKVVFADINFELQIGDNHFWVAAGVDAGLVGNANVRFTVPANGINVSDTLLPQSNVVFSKSHKLKESVFYDDFEDGGISWTLNPNFEVGWPEGTTVSTRDNPSTPFNGTKILATDLNGGYLPNINSSTAYYAYTPVLNLKYYINTSLYMHSYFTINGPDNAVIEISTDGGANWDNIWTSDPSSNNSYWSEFVDNSISDLVDRKPQFQLRMGIDESQGTPWPGLNVDNFAILGEKLLNDVGITKIIYPYDDCLDCGNDTVRIWVKNYADGTAPSSIPVYFGLWGQDSTLVRDTITGGIAKDDSTLFTFSQTANFPQGDYYDKFIVGIDLSTDQDPRNDTMTKYLTIQKNSMPDHFDDYEYKGGIWLPKEGSRWENKDMSGTITTDPESPHIWVLAATGNYGGNDTSYVESGCFDLSGPARNIIQFDYWSETEYGVDGARFEYSVDNGVSWNIIEDPLHNVYWNWISENVTALGSFGWSGSNSWTTAKAILPLAVEDQEKVKFRLFFRSDAATSYPQGFAFNDFALYNAPIDIGVSQIDIPKDTCQFFYPNEMNVWVKNYGYNAMHTSDTIILGYDFESDPAVIDTVFLSTDLAPGDSVMVNLPTSFNVETPGIYQIKAYTLIEDDPYFYGSNNDTTTKLFEIWQNPITGLVDTISTREPDTLIIEPNVLPEYTYLWDFKGANQTGSTYDVAEPGTYYLTITETNHGCSTADSIYIELLFNDVGISEITAPLSACGLRSDTIIDVIIQNFGTDSLIISDKILLYYQVNGGALVKDSIILTEPLYSGAQKAFRFTNNPVDLSAEGDYEIVAFTDYGGDTIANNDTATSNITVYGFPDISLGADTTVIGLSYLLSPPSDPEFVSFEWSDGDTQLEKLIDSTGTYSLTVTDINGCETIDNIYVYLKIRDIRVVDFISPFTSCNREEPDEVILRIENAGTDTLTSSDLIEVSYTFQRGVPVANQISIPELLPGEFYDHNFGTSLDLIAIGTYNFEGTAVTASDLRPGNNTLDLVVQTMENPVIDLGIQDDDVFKVTEKTLDAGYGENYIYLWHNGSKNQYYTVTDIENVSVLVTDTVTGCYGSDEALVYLDILDYTIQSLSLGSTACSDSYEDVEVNLLNNGNLPRQGADIDLEYYLGGSFLFTEKYESNGTWIAGGVRTHLTQHTIELNEPGNKELEVIISTTGDLRTDNDNFVRDIEVLPLPDIAFSGPAKEVDFPYTLDAGAGQDTYLWSNGATTSSIVVNGAGTYSVTVTSADGCENSESIYLDTELALSSFDDEEVDIAIYPNPTENQFTVELQFNEPGKRILEVFNAQNTTIFNREINELEFKEEFFVGDLPPGIYFIRIRDEKAYQVNKLIIR